MISKVLEIELNDYIAARYQKCKESVQYLCGDDQNARNLLHLLWEIEFWKSKVETTEVNKTLVNALETWENLFYPIEGMGITPIDYTLESSVKACLQVGRYAMKEAKNAF